MLGAAMLLASCGEYQKVLKSHDADYRLDFAKRAFEQKKYTQAATVLEDIVTQFKGSEKAEDSLYLLALSNYENKDYETAGSFFKTYYTRFPKASTQNSPATMPATAIISTLLSHSLTRAVQSTPFRNSRLFSTTSPKATKWPTPRMPSSSFRTN